MLRFFGHMGFRLHLLFILSIILLSHLPRDNADLEQFLLDVESCAGFCLLGIRPNETSIDSAVVILESHPWVDELNLNASGNGYGQIRWTWTEQASTWVDSSYRGRITFYWDDEAPNTPYIYDETVETITILTHLPIYQLQTYYGVPDAGSASYRSDETLIYQSMYHQSRGVSSILTTVADCPGHILNIWSAKTQLRISIGYGRSEPVSLFELDEIC